MWTLTDERIFQEKLAAIRFERRGEIDALARKLARQTGPIAAFRVRHRINEREAVSMTQRFLRTETLIHDELRDRLIDNGRTAEVQDGFDPLSPCC